VLRIAVKNGWKQLYKAWHHFSPFLQPNKCLKWGVACAGLSELMMLQGQFDKIDSQSFRLARNRANPFEQISKEFFQNRAALKMAELDYLCGYALTQPSCCLTWKPPRNNANNQDRRRTRLERWKNPHKPDNWSRDVSLLSYLYTRNTPQTPPPLKWAIPWFWINPPSTIDFYFGRDML